jgi:hypothetical protein
LELTEMAVTEETIRDPFVEVPHEGDRHVDQILAGSSQTAPLTTGVFLADVTAFDLQGRPVIQYHTELRGERLIARSTVRLLSAQPGCQVVVMCEGGDLRRPIVMGVLQEPSRADTPSVIASPVSIDADGKRQVITAEREIVLRCGEASITLTRAGKVILKGTYVVSRSSGYNKIKGAVVDIN